MLLDEVADEQAECPPALAQRRHGDREDVQPVPEVLAEAARLRISSSSAPVGRGDQPHVHPDRPVAADALELSLLDHPQELRLQLQRQLADLVEEQRAAVGGLEPPLALGDRPGEGAPLVAEELALDERRRQGGAVRPNEGALPRGLRLWIARATSSLPTPVSPWSRTVLEVGATCLTRERT